MEYFVACYETKPAFETPLYCLPVPVTPLSRRRCRRRWTLLRAVRLASGCHHLLRGKGWGVEQLLSIFHRSKMCMIPAQSSTVSALPGGFGHFPPSRILKNPAAPKVTWTRCFCLPAGEKTEAAPFVVFWKTSC